MVRSIEHASAERYLSYLAPVSGGRTARTHAAVIRLDNDQMHMHVKLHDPKNSRGLVNEITGYLLAKECGIAVPARAALVEITGRHLKKAWPSSKEDSLVGWATVTVNGHTPRYRYESGGLQYVLKDLIHWVRLPCAIALDEWLSNQDRNLGNLIRVAAKSYCLIDHDHIIDGPRWMADFLDPATSVNTNTLAKLLWNDYADAPREAGNAMVVSAERFFEAYQKALPELRFWWHMLLPASDISALSSFLMNRAKVCADLIANRYRVIPT